MIDPLPTVTPASTTIYLDFIYNSTDLKWDMVKKTVDRLGLITSVSSASSHQPNVDNCDMYIVTAQGATASFLAPAGTPQQGHKLIIRMKDNGAARALSWASIYRAVMDPLPTVTTANTTIYLDFIYNSTDRKWDMVKKTVDRLGLITSVSSASSHQPNVDNCDMYIVTAQGATASFESLLSTLHIPALAPPHENPSWCPWCPPWGLYSVVGYRPAPESVFTGLSFAGRRGVESAR